MLRREFFQKVVGFVGGCIGLPLMPKPLATTDTKPRQLPTSGRVCTIRKEDIFNDRTDMLLAASEAFAQAHFKAVMKQWEKT